LRVVCHVPPTATLTTHTTHTVNTDLSTAKHSKKKKTAQKKTLKKKDAVKKKRHSGSVLSYHPSAVNSAGWLTHTHTRTHTHILERCNSHNIAIVALARLLRHHLRPQTTVKTPLHLSPKP
jgi:hypothetical protein